MGKITTLGKAQEECQYDIVCITVRFKALAKKSSEALDKVMNDCEDFLSYLHDNGVDIDSINAGKDELIQDHYRDETTVSATREIKIVLPYETTYVNSLLDDIRKHDYDCEIETEYELSDYDLIHEKLIKKAIEDSRHKAEMIADELNQKIVGIELVGINKQYQNHEVYEHERGVSFMPSSHMNYSNKIGVATTQESENVEVVWQIEDK